MQAINIIMHIFGVLICKIIKPLVSMVEDIFRLKYFLSCLQSFIQQNGLVLELMFEMCVNILTGKKYQFNS